MGVEGEIDADPLWLADRAADRQPDERCAVPEREQRDCEGGVVPRAGPTAAVPARRHREALVGEDVRGREPRYERQQDQPWPGRRRPEPMARIDEERRA